MRSNHLATPLLLAGLIALAAGCNSDPETPTRSEGAAEATTRTVMPPSLAKAKLSEATAAAKGWKSDAFLIQVGTHGVGADGKHLMWDYGYYSPVAKTCLVVKVGPKGASTTESGDETCASGELKDFIDSDHASKVARSNGITAPQTTMFVSIAPTPQGERAAWSVMDESGMNPGNVMLDIDAATGAVLNKTTQ